MKKSLRCVSPALMLGALLSVGMIATKPAVATQAFAAIAAVVNCASSSPCDGGTNTGTGPGVHGESFQTFGVHGITHKGGTPPLNVAVAGVLGTDMSASPTNTNGVAGYSQNGNGAFFRTANGVNALIAQNLSRAAGHGTVLIDGGNAGSSPEVSIYAHGTGFGFPLAGFDDKYGTIFYFGNNGDLTIKGHIHTAGGTLAPVNATAPMIEHVGSATLRNGSATVALDASLRSSVSSGGAYHIFVTPLAETNGLFVGKKTLSDFTVRELHGGTSNIAFDYRIVVIDAHRAVDAAQPRPVLLR